MNEKNQNLDCHVYNQKIPYLTWGAERTIQDTGDIS